jgi:uncharacterized protein (DUF2225 family)
MFHPCIYLYYILYNIYCNKYLRNIRYEIINKKTNQICKIVQVLF